MFHILYFISFIFILYCGVSKKETWTGSITLAFIGNHIYSPQQKAWVATEITMPGKKKWHGEQNPADIHWMAHIKFLLAKLTCHLETQTIMLCSYLLCLLAHNNKKKS